MLSSGDMLSAGKTSLLQIHVAGSIPGSGGGFSDGREKQNARVQIFRRTVKIDPEPSTAARFIAQM